MKISRVYGHDGSLYRTKIRLFGKYALHIFHRGDIDKAYHDHPNDFWTFPLRGYWEEVLDLESHHPALNWVWPWRWHFRAAEYTHKISCIGFNRTVVTLVYEEPHHRIWGFHSQDSQGNWIWRFWKRYLKDRGMT